MPKPDLGPFATYLGRHAGSRFAFWLGDDADAFMRLGEEFVLLGADRADRIASVRARVGGTWLEHDFDRAPLVLGDPALMKNAIVVCNDLLARPSSREHAAATLRRFLDAGATVLATAPAPGSGKPLATDANAFLRSLLGAGLEPTFLGVTASDDKTFAKTTHLAIVDPEPKRPQLWRATPDAFSVVAVMTVFNEADVIENVLEILFAQGISVYLMDNWSTDDTLERASRYIGRGLIGIERNPLRDTETYDLERAMIRVEHLCRTLEADWFLYYDIDEIRRAPFRGVGLRDALYAVDRAGYSTVDFTILNFRPIDDSFRTGMKLESHFPYFEFGATLDLLRQRKCWKNTGQNVQLIERGGHDALFPGRRVYPYKFTTKHYSIRSQQHGERKVVKERRDRFNVREHESRKWHVHYEGEKTPNFLGEAEKMIRWDDTFDETYLVERLSGIGAARAPEFVHKYLDYHGESV